MEVRERIAMIDVVLVIDMQRGFLEEGNPLFCGEAARRIIPNVQRLLDRETARGSTIIFTADTHAPDDLEFEMWPPHCVEGTEEVEIIPELASYPGEKVPKTRYSAFYGTDLAERLEELQPEGILVCGCCTDICVLHTVTDARNRDHRVQVYTDCVAVIDQDMARFALKHMEQILGAELVSLGEGSSS
jgi:nicotinamidase-related amidase